MTRTGLSVAIGCAMPTHTVSALRDVEWQRGDERGSSTGRTLNVDDSAERLDAIAQADKP